MLPIVYEHVDKFLSPPLTPRKCLRCCATAPRRRHLWNPTSWLSSALRLSPIALSPASAPAEDLSRMHSKGSRFTLGVWGLSCVRRTLRLCSQPSATVRVRAVWPLPMVSSAKGVAFGGFQCRIASFRVAGVPLCDIPTCFMTCQKSFCVAGAILCHVFRRCVAFFVAGAALERPPMSFLRGKRSTFMPCCMFFANRIVSAAQSGDKVEIPWQAWHFVTCDEHLRMPRTKRWFWVRFVRKLVGKYRF